LHLKKEIPGRAKKTLAFFARFLYNWPAVTLIAVMREVAARAGGFLRGANVKL
jgi:hypothetical protein